MAQLLTLLSTLSDTAQPELHTWLAKQSVQQAYSDEQARYWFTQAQQHSRLSSHLCMLDWRAGYAGE